MATQEYTIETHKFKDDNALNLFIVHVRDMRSMQKRYEELAETLPLSHPNRVVALDDKIVFEKQVDDILETLPLWWPFFCEIYCPKGFLRRWE